MREGILSDECEGVVEGENGEGEGERRKETPGHVKAWKEGVTYRYQQSSNQSKYFKRRKRRRIETDKLNIRKRRLTVLSMLLYLRF